jgi:hypothetical protein
MTTTPTAKHPNLFDGPTYVAEHDEERLTGQLHRVYAVMSNGAWWSLEELAAEILRTTGHHDTPAAISARIRDLRKKRFGQFPVASKRRRQASVGWWEYRIAGERGSGDPAVKVHAGAERVRLLHRKETIGDWTRCAHCHYAGGSYPCATIRALDGSGEFKGRERPVET